MVRKSRNRNGDLNTTEISFFNTNVKHKKTFGQETREYLANPPSQSRRTREKIFR